MTHVRKRRLYLLFIIVNLPGGLATHWYPQYIPALVTTYGGDVLSANYTFLRCGLS